MTDNPPKLILILGGSTFMGKTLLENLRKDRQYQTVFVNRGRKYWNGQNKMFMKQDYYYGNRDDHEDFSKVISYVNRKYKINEDNKWTAIVDFSAYQHVDIDCVMRAVMGLCHLYIFISTDSQYDALGIEYSGQSIKQLIDIPEMTVDMKEQAKERQQYGYGKLKCQMYLRKFRDLDKFPYISLILPDVIGPYDDTGRYWAYLKWLQKSPVEIDSEGEEKKCSLVFSLDVVRLIQRIIRERPSKEALCQSYNLAFQENPTLKQLINQIAKSIKIEPTFNKVKKASCFYPSVDFGHLNIDKARNALQWQPTKLKDAIEQTTAFFVNKGQEYSQEEEAAQRKLRKKLKH